MPCNRVTIDCIRIGNRIYYTLKHTNRDCTLQVKITHRLVISVTVFVELLGSSFQHCNVLGSSVKQLLSSLAGTFELQVTS
jgi:hypothetical protein